MIRRPRRTIRTYTLFPCTTLVRLTRARGAVLRLGKRVQPVRGVGVLDLHDRHLERGAGAAPVPADRAGPCSPHRWPRRRCGEQRSEEHTSELQSLMRTSYAVFCLNKQSKRHASTKQHYTSHK